MSEQQNCQYSVNRGIDTAYVGQNLHCTQCRQEYIKSQILTITLLDRTYSQIYVGFQFKRPAFSKIMISQNVLQTLEYQCYLNHQRTFCFWTHIPNYTLKYLRVPNNSRRLETLVLRSQQMSKPSNRGLLLEIHQTVNTCNADSKN